MKHSASAHILTIGLLISLTGGLTPFAARAAVTDVPVSTGLDAQVSSIDQATTEMLMEFTRYAKDFRTTMFDSGSSFREFLAGNPNPNASTYLYNPGKYPTSGGGKSAKPEKACATRAITNPGSAKPTPGGAWEKLIEEGQRNVADSFSETQVNDSTSVSCLLQEIVEQNKLALNLQIHQLLNDQIQAAQAKAFAASQQNLIMAANIDWVKSGNVRVTKDSEGNVLETKSFSALSPDLKQDTMQRVGDAYAKGILGDMNAPQFNIAETIDKFRLGRVALNSANKTQISTKQKGIESLTCNVTGTIASGGLGFESVEQFERFRAGDIEARGASYIDTVNAIAAHPQCTQSGAETMLQLALDEQYTEIDTADKEDRLANNGFSSIRKCKDGSPDCEETEVTLPGSTLGNLFSNALGSTERRLENVKDEKDLAGFEEGTSIAGDMRAEGIYNFDTSSLTGTTGSETAASFYDAIKDGYFDLQGGTTDWALGAMLQIYDHSMDKESRYAPGSGSVGTTAETPAP